MNLLQDDPRKLFYRLLLPAIGGTLVYCLYSFIDMIAIGHGVGAMGTAAYAVILPLFQIPSFTSIICGIGGSVLISTAKGKGNKEESNKWFSTSLLAISILIAITWALTWFFRVPILRFFGADDTILPYALDYGKMIILGFPFFTMAGFLPFILRNDNNPDLPLYSSIVGGVINIIGDYIFVFPLQMGMYGAGLATLLGSMVQNLVLLTHFASKKKEVKLSKLKARQIIKDVKTILPYGFGSAFMEVSTIVTTIITNRQIMTYSGNAQLAVYGFMLTAVALFQFTFLGIGQAAQPIISTNFGANNRERVKTAKNLNCKVTSLTAIVFTVFCVACPNLITRIFVEETKEVMEIAPTIIRIYVLFLPFMGFNTATIINLQSVGKDRKANLITLLRGIVLNSIALITLPMLLGANGIWWATVLSEALVFFYCIVLS